MYEEFYGFRTRPFSILPDADFLYLSKGHRFALSLLEYGLGSQTGFTVITGEIGSGKTTLVQYLLQNFAADHTIGHITNTAELNADLLKWLLQAFGVQSVGNSNVELYQQLVAYIKQQYAHGHDCVIIIDEAQHLTAETLESLRLLSNINIGKDHLLKIILVGQPELSQTLSRPDLVQFSQRISTSFHLKPLNLLETREYIRNRLKIAGGSESVFESLASDFIYMVSGGVPRQINILCDTALVYGFADGKRRVDLNTVLGVLRDRAAGQRVNEPHSIAALDRNLIEKMLKETREKEFAREASEGISEREESADESIQPETVMAVEARSAPTSNAPITKSAQQGKEPAGQMALFKNPRSNATMPAKDHPNTAQAARQPELHSRLSENLEASLRAVRKPELPQKPATTAPARAPRPFKIYPAQDREPDRHELRHVQNATETKLPSTRRHWPLKAVALVVIALILAVGFAVLVRLQPV